MTTAPQDIDRILLACKLLSGLSLLVLLALVADVWRRQALPEVAYGGITLDRSRMRWLWTGFLAGSTLAATAGNPVLTHSETFENSELEATLPEGTPRVSSQLDLPLPFYHLKRERVTHEGRLVQETVDQAVLFPWEMISAFLAYFILVVRWNPESRWALRILRGKRWVRKHRP